MSYRAQLLATCVSTSTGTRGTSTLEPLSTPSIPSVMTFFSQVSAFSASPLSSVDAEDLYRSGYPSGADVSSPEVLDNNRIFHSYHRRAFAR